jgi:hypothetical protein
MKNIILLLSVALFLSGNAQKAVKVKELKLKYTLPDSWNAEAYASPAPWENTSNNLCKCAGILFFKSHKNGKMNVVIYPSTTSGLDSTKRNFVGALRFEPVEKYDKSKNSFFSFEKRKSNFTDTKTNKKSFEVLRYLTKIEGTHYIIYAWQENAGVLNPTVEKELYEMVNGIEPIN